MMAEVESGTSHGQMAGDVHAAEPARNDRAKRFVVVDSSDMCYAL